LVPNFPSIREAIGSGLGFIGLAISILDIQSEGTQVTVQGDLAALLGAFSFIGYLYAGRNLRPWMPLFLYAMPVTLVSAIVLTITSFLTTDTYELICFGYFSTSFWFLLITYIAFFPGFFGHTGINYIIKHISPLTICVTLLLEPAVGSIISFFLGLTSLPGLWTFIGAPIVFLGLLIVSLTDSFISKIWRFKYIYYSRTWHDERI